MTQTGKCDTCRQRKVKCDEEKPKCGACRKKDRICTYSYGKASAVVVQDPNQLTKHGKSKAAPVVYALDSQDSESSSSISTPSDLHITTEREAENGQGFFQTLAPLSRRKQLSSRRSLTSHKKQLELYLRKLLEESAITSIRPSSSENLLIARYINMLGPNSSNLQPLSILGTWIRTIPSRVGSNNIMDLAVEFLINSHEVFKDDTYSKRRLAQASKEKALKELQLSVLQSSNVPTYEVLLATKMHYAAEALLGIGNMYHAVHAFGLAELLKSGMIANVDDEHFWSLIDNTYIDDVNEAMLGSRKSVYDNEFYLSSTYPPPITSSAILLSPSQRASMAIMHIFVQCPRLNCMVRRAVMKPDDTEALAAAITLAESLWQLDLEEQVDPFLKASTTTVPVPPAAELIDIMPESINFDSVQSMILCTRYWMLVNVLSGLTDTLYRYFWLESSLSYLPNPEVMYQKDIAAALHLAESHSWAMSVSLDLPLVPLRLHTPLQISIGPWYRTIRKIKASRLNSSDLNVEFDPASTFELDRAERMKAWLVEQCNLIHKDWGVSQVTEKPLLETLDAMCGEKIPDWLPVRVRFEAEDGEMVLKFEYKNKDGTYEERWDVTEDPKGKSVQDRIERKIAAYKRSYPWYEPDVTAPDFNPYELPIRGMSATVDGLGTAEVEQANESTRITTMEPKNAANFIHGTGRNLCSTSGWWPMPETPSTLLLDSTHKASAFSSIPRPSLHQQIDPNMEHDEDSHPGLGSSF